MPYQVNEIDPAKCALIVVDMENDFVAAGAPMETPAGRAMLPNLKRAINFCREVGARVIYTTHVHRRDGCDAGMFATLWPPIGAKAGLVDGTKGIEIYDEIAPKPGEIVVKKHRYSAFYNTDMEIILRGWGGRHCRCFGRYDGKLLPRDRTGCTVPGLQGSVPVRRDRNIRLSRRWTGCHVRGGSSQGHALHPFGLDRACDESR